MIGGSDTVLWVPEKAPAAKLILKSVRRHWPKYVFQDADDDLPLDPAKLPSLPVPKGREFFLYRDMKAAQDWLKSGATHKNKNTLIYVILGKRRKRDLGLRSITLVGGAWTGVLGKFLADLKAEFDAVGSKAPTKSRINPLAVNGRWGTELTLDGKPGVSRNEYGVRGITAPMPVVPRKN